MMNPYATLKEREDMLNLRQITIITTKGSNGIFINFCNTFLFFLYEIIVNFTFALKKKEKTFTEIQFW